ncbi:hypothetical protein AMECASPLE_027571 [Ameca splendens]|uniref:Uncharacterized protein n=1 Tax=Ameca splendens TaxID=208324 RepID=A0ABV0YGD5_9TELE
MSKDSSGHASSTLSGDWGQSRIGRLGWRREITLLSLPDDVVLLAPSSQDPQHALGRFTVVLVHCVEERTQLKSEVLNLPVNQSVAVTFGDCAIIHLENGLFSLAESG